MADLKRIEINFPKNYHEIFEDISTDIFCRELGLKSSVNRPKNHQSIESLPVQIGPNVYGYQAKYYDAATKLKDKKKEFITCISEARQQGVTDLLLFVNKDHTENSRTGKAPEYLLEIENFAQGSENESTIRIDWWTLSRIEATLDMKGYEDIKHRYVDLYKKKSLSLCLLISILLIIMASFLTQVSITIMPHKWLIILESVIFTIFSFLYTFFAERKLKRESTWTGIAWVFVTVLVIAIYLNSSKIQAFFYKVNYNISLLRNNSEEAQLSIENAFNRELRYGEDAGNFYFSQGNFSKAIYYYEKALSVKEEDANLYYLKGRAYHSWQLDEKDVEKAKDYLQKATDDLERAVEKKPENPEYNYELAKVYFDAFRDLDKALLCLNTAIKNSSDNTAKADYYYWRGRVRLNQNDYEGFKLAKNDFTDALEKNKNNADFYYWRGVVSYKIGNYEDLCQAYNDFDTARMLDANNDEYSFYCDLISSKLVLGGWGDDDNGRPDYTLDEINSGVLGKQITFNSISDSKIGNEKNYVGVKTLTEQGIVWKNSVNVQDGEIYTIRLYVHNNSPLGEEAIAENVRATFSLPTTVSKKQDIIGYLDCSNSKPTRYWDGVSLLSEDYFYIEYVKGSAKYNNNLGTMSLPDEIISSSGALLGYNNLDGNIPGCYEYSGVVTIDIKVHKSVIAKLAMSVRLKGTEEWAEVVDAQVGDEVEYQIEFVNLLSDELEDVAIRDVLPTNVIYVDGSTIMYNASHPNGVSLLGDHLTSSGINIGSYKPASNAYIRFTGRVVNYSLAEGLNQLVNWANVTVNGYVYKDDASVMVRR